MSDPTPESLLPYETWTEEALRLVVVRAIGHASEHGLPAGHHFYLTFRTDFAGVVIPPRLRAQYPEEMTIVLQHQFWDLKADEASGLITVSLSFGGVPASLAVPLVAVTGFADPYVQFGLRFGVGAAAPEAEPEPDPEPEAAAEAEPAEAPQVVSLDAFRRRAAPSKD